jgi:hypothetical protein
MDILSAIGSFASIIGLSIKLMDDFEREHPDSIGKAMGALKALSVTGKTWKDIHAKYHAVERIAPKVLAALETTEEGQRVSKSLAKINSNDLRLAFDEPSWAMVLEDLENDLEPSIDTLIHANNKAKSEKIKILSNLRDSGHVETAERIQRIVNAQEKIVNIHQDFILLLKKLKSFVEEDSWEKDQIEYVLKHRSFFRVKLSSLIGSTDTALMAILDLYNAVIDSVDQ